MRNLVNNLLLGGMFLLAAAAVTAPMAHVLELPNKLGLDAQAWLLVQQRLYRGWGPVFGTIDIAAVATGLTIAVLSLRRRAVLVPILLAVAIFLAMIGVFFAFNAPVNQAFNSWSPATIPSDWSAYRTQWETGHALSALLSVAALVSVARACIASWRS